MVTLVHFQVLSAALFAIGLYGVLARRSAVLIVMSIELMLNAVNINLIAAASHLNGTGNFIRFDGQIIAIFVITIAAAEVGLALAIILRMYRNRSTVNVDEIDLMRW
jgi:NADH:ubiquinone oxidoreductase subunit K